MKTPFVKMHGLGNDYVFIDGRDGIEIDASSVVAICDRRAGVGGDGVVILRNPMDVAADARMLIFNADGSDGGVCGNGLRCLARWLRGDGIVPEGPIRVETPGGVVEMNVGPTLEDDTVRVEVAMPAPRFASAEIPASIPGVDSGVAVIDRLASEVFPDLALSSLARLTLVSMGNPHAVLSLADAEGIERDELDRMVRAVGPAIEHHPCFPKRINVHLMVPGEGDGLRMSSWERGSGATRACGTGACAVVVARVMALASRKARPDSEKNPWRVVELPGGELEIAWSGTATDSVRQRGPAVESFRGRIEIEPRSVSTGPARST